MRCLRSVARIKWQDRVPNTSVLEICGLTGIEAMLLQAQLRWVGHVVPMPDPKQVFYGQLMVNRRPPGGHPIARRYKDKDSLKTNLKACSIDRRELSHAPFNKSAWSSRCRDAVIDFEDKRVDSLRLKRSRRKADASSNQGVWPCDVCGRSCQSRIGLFTPKVERSVRSTAQSRDYVFARVLGLNISKTVEDKDSVPMGHQYEMAYGESNGHVTNDIT